MVSIVDKNGKIWVWAAQKGDENLKSFQHYPTLVDSLKTN
jgi:hypothetical protein